MKKNQSTSDPDSRPSDEAPRYRRLKRSSVNLTPLFRAAVIRYGTHDSGCNVAWRLGKCNCGFAEALAAATYQSDTAPTEKDIARTHELMKAGILPAEKGTK